MRRAAGSREAPAGKVRASLATLAGTWAADTCDLSPLVEPTVEHAGDS